jgi:hypothetical protein
MAPVGHKYDVRLRKQLDSIISLLKLGERLDIR